MKYKKKPVIIDAVQWNGKNVREVYEFINGKVNINGRLALDRWCDFEKLNLGKKWPLKTLESDDQTQVADVGDFIIKGVKGEFYPCKPDIFYMTYEKVEES